MPSPCCGNHICSFIPPYLLRHIAEAQQDDQEATAHARQTLEHSLAFRGSRTSGQPTDRPSRSGFIPQYLLNNLATSEASDEDTRKSATDTLDDQKQAATQQKPATLKAKREVHDANHTTNESALPGKLITSDASPTTASIEKTATETYENLGDVYKFFANIFGRDSIDGNGLTLIGSVHFGKNYENAFWDGKQMVFGDGGTFLNNFTRSLDVVGHELTHGVTEHTAALVYHGQSGALNESISDVFGSMIRQYRYKETVEEADWLIGEDCILPTIKGLALRSMKAPGTAYDDPRVGKDPQPADMDGYQNLPDNDGGDYGGVHINSGIPNRAFYLAATGLGGHSWEKAGPIWYNTITSKEITNKCNFQQFATLTCNAAKSLYGDAEEKIVRDAWTTVKVLK